MQKKKNAEVIAIEFTIFIHENKRKLFLKNILIKIAYLSMCYLNNTSGKLLISLINKKENLLHHSYIGKYVINILFMKRINNYIVLFNIICCRNTSTKRKLYKTSS